MVYYQFLSLNTFKQHLLGFPTQKQHGAYIDVIPKEKKCIQTGHHFS